MQNLAGIVDLQKMVVNDATSFLFKRRMALLTFGYACIVKTDLLKWGITEEELCEAAEDYGWTLSKGVFSYGITLEYEAHERGHGLSMTQGKAKKIDTTRL